jgi:hypothetical protein
MYYLRASKIFTPTIIRLRKMISKMFSDIFMGTCERRKTAYATCLDVCGDSCYTNLELYPVRLFPLLVFRNDKEIWRCSV